MKIKVRNGVFETNSSSTHSFTILTRKQLKEEKQKYSENEQEITQSQIKNYDDLSDLEQQEILDDCFEITKEKNLEKYSFTLTTPIQKICWLKGLIDNAENRKKDEKYNIVRFYNLLKEEYCKLENITEAAADYRIDLEGYRNNIRCRGGKCDQYFCEKQMGKCDCGFQNYLSIYLKLSNAKNGLSLEEFAKEFLTDKYIVAGRG